MRSFTQRNSMIIAKTLKSFEGHGFTQHLFNNEC